MSNTERNETIWFLIEYFSTALEELLEGDSTSAEAFMGSYPSLTKDLDPKLAEVMKRGLFLILKSKDIPSKSSSYPKLN